MAGKNQQQLRTDIVLGGIVSNSFMKLGQAIENLGTMSMKISDKLIQFGEESVDVYRQYEDNMLAAKGALTTTYDSYVQLEGIMDRLDDKAQEWASSTIFHTSDVSQAINEAAHAGWDYEQMLEGIPAAMNIAQAGNITLSEGLDYVIKMLNATGTSFEDAGEMMDQWAYAANSSATNIDEIGQAFLKMGATAQFADSNAELFTMIGTLANMGTVGTEAGTLLRNSMLRIIAPTEKAAKTMGTLKLTEEEIAELEADSGLLGEASNILKEVGFSAYDSQGNLKGMLTIWKELGAATGQMTDKQKNTVLSAIFPTRTITGAMNLLQGAANNYGGLYEGILGSTGYAANVAAIQMSGLTGSIEILLSKYEELKRATGEALSDDVKNAANWIGGLIDKVNGLDDDSFGVLVGTLEGIAAVGPALLVAGGAIKTIGFMMTPLGATTAALLAFGGTVGMLRAIDKNRTESLFGNMVLDIASLETSINSVTAAYNRGYSEVNKYRIATENAVTSYETASSTLSGELFSKMLTGTKLTDPDIEKLNHLGDDMYTALVDGIANANSGALSYWQILLGGDPNNADALNEINGITNKAYTEAIEEANSISQDMRDALTSAFEDGTVTEDEYQKILGVMKAYNEAMARANYEAATQEQQLALEKTLWKGQNASYDDIQTLAEDIITQRETAMGTNEDMFMDYYLRAKMNGVSDESLKRAMAEHDEEKAALEKQYNDYLMRLWDDALKNSDLSGMYGQLTTAANGYLNFGFSAENTARNIHNLNTFGMNDEYDQTMKVVRQIVNSFGGVEELERLYGYYNSIGDTAAANRFGVWSVLGNADHYKGGELMNTAIGIDQKKSIANVDKSIAAMQAEADRKTISVDIDTQNRAADYGLFGNIANAFSMFAEGGRATVPSIFGEAGPEWAIPEEHTPRTARLLSAAAEASGFSGSTTVVYSPTIYANDANGLSEELLRDKIRLDEWYRGIRERERLETY